MIPDRFKKLIKSHLIGNYCNISNYPVHMYIYGEPGIGKTYQLRTYLKELGIDIFSVSAANLEDKEAGEPAKTIQTKYNEAGSQMYLNKGLTALVIDDIDTTVGEWENYQGTVNHLHILATLMHIADNPTDSTDLSRGLKILRVPVFFTGNYNERMYEPLIREGRMKKYEYIPTFDEKVEILIDLYGQKHEESIRKIIKELPDKPISFFTASSAEWQVERFVDVVSDEDFMDFFSNENNKTEILNRYLKSNSDIELDSLFNTIIAKCAEEVKAND